MPELADDGGERAARMNIVGVDGCRGGWLIASSDTTLSRVNLEVSRSLATLFQAVRGGDIVAVIDVPIGLPDDGPRACDIAARQLLGQVRASSVFPAPCRPALPAKTFEEACDLNEAASGRKLSHQAFGLLPKIREVDGLITPELQDHIREGHPEVSFAVLSERGAGLPHRKKDPEGEIERLNVLDKFLPPIDLESARTLIGRGLAQRDDLLDALACLVTASRVAKGTAITLPAGEVYRDGRGLRMEIVS